MHVGLLTTSYPHHGDPIAGCFVRAMALALVRAGHRVTVVCARRAGDRPVDDAGITVVASRGLTRGIFYDGGAPDRLALGAVSSVSSGVTAADSVAALGVAALARLDACDALVSHFVLPSGVLAGLLRKGRPHVMVVHGTDGWLLAQAPRAVRARVLGMATAHWCTHTRLWEALGCASPRLHVGPMPLEGSDPVVCERDALRAVTVGRLVAVKGVERAVRAVLRTREAGAAWTLDVLGEGPLRGALEAMVPEGERGAITFHGAVSPTVRDAWLARASVLLQPSRRMFGWRQEGAPLAVMEAMAAGCAVIATDTGGVRELVGDAGVVVPEARAEEAMVDALRMLAEDGARRQAMGARGVARAAAWRWEAVLPWLVDALRGV